MKVLRESIDEQTLLIIPSTYPTIINLEITPEDTREAQLYSDLSVTTNFGYLEIRMVFDIKENNFYSFRVTNEGNTIFRGKIFCTNQENYKINDGKYIEYPKNTKYVIYEK